ncbi:MAG: tetratricopeptide repeat protein [Bacteroidia bacterium]|nr:tetratricopeptide repeat protein [Bacteroidia bacterium]
MSKFTFLSAQQSKADSLVNALKSSKKDTNRVTILNLLATELKDNYPDSAIEYTTKASELATTLKFTSGIVKANLTQGIALANKGDYKDALICLNKALQKNENKLMNATILGNIGLVYHDQNSYDTTLLFYNKALKITQELGDKKQEARNLANIGIVYYDQSDYSKALEYYFKALKIDEQLNDKSTIKMDLSNIGIVYHDLEDYPKALEYYQRSLTICRELGNKRDIAKAVGNIAILYDDQGQYRKALDYYSEAMKLNEEVGNKRSLAINLSNAGGLYVELGKESKINCNCTNDSGYFKRANECYQKALKINEEIGNKRSQGINKGNLGELYLHLNKPKEAEFLLLEALRTARSLGELTYVKIWHEALTELYESQNNHPKAFDSYKKFIAVRDSISNEENVKKQTELEMQYEFDKKEAETKAEQEKKDAIALAEKKRQKSILILISIVLLLVIAFAIFIFRSLKTTQKQKVIIQEQKSIVEHQKHLVEEKQKEIIDSINYAKRIQMSILPSEKYIERIINKKG